MAQFRNGLDVDGGSLKPFLLENAQRVKDHAIAMAKKYERRLEYLASPIRKEDTARKLAERDGIDPNAAPDSCAICCTTPLWQRHAPAHGGPYERALAKGLSRIEASVILSLQIARTAWSIYAHKSHFDPQRISQAPQRITQRLT